MLIHVQDLIALRVLPKVHLKAFDELQEPQLLDQTADMWDSRLSSNQHSLIESSVLRALIYLDIYSSMLGYKYKTQI